MGATRLVERLTLRPCAQCVNYGQRRFQAGLAGRRANPAAAALAEFVCRRGLERASKVLIRWAR